MFKIGIVSKVYKNYNYGGMLQGYAMVEALRKCGVEAEQIRFDSSIPALSGTDIERAYGGGDAFDRCSLRNDA